MGRIFKRAICGILLLVLFEGIGLGQEILEKPEKERMINEPIVSMETEGEEWLTFLPKGEKEAGEEPQVTVQTVFTKGSTTGKVTLDLMVPGAFSAKSEKGTFLRIPTASSSFDEGRPVVPGLVTNFVLPGNADLTGIKLL